MKDPIVEEVREVRKRLELEFHGDMHQFAEQLRKAQQKFVNKVVVRGSAKGHSGSSKQS